MIGGLMLPSEGADGPSLSLFALMIAIVAAGCLALGLRRIARGADANCTLAHGALLCGAGLCLAAGATVYVHDIVNMPEAVATCLIGTGLGYLIARRGDFPALTRLAPALHLLGGIAGAATALAGWLNPLAFGLTAGPGTLPLLLASLSSALVIAAAGVMTLRRGMCALDNQAGLGAATGCMAALLGFTFGNPPLILCGGVLAGAGLLLRQRLRDGRDSR